MPLAVLIALEKRTTLNVWPKAIRNLQGVDNPIKSKLISLNPGDMLIFRGDLVHAGSKYKDENVRLHAYLDSPLIDRINNRTFIISLDSPPQVKSLIFQ